MEHARGCVSSSHPPTLHAMLVPFHSRIHPSWTNGALEIEICSSVLASVPWVWASRLSSFSFVLRVPFLVEEDRLEITHRLFLAHGVVPHAKAFAQVLGSPGLVVPSLFEACIRPSASGSMSSWVHAILPRAPCRRCVGSSSSPLSPPMWPIALV